MQSIQALMDGIFDYAGLYPPANLEMTPMVKRFAEAFDGTESWLLSRVIVPVGKFESFERAAESLAPSTNDAATDACWCVSALTAAADDPQFPEDMASIEAFNERHIVRGAAAIAVDTIECRASGAAAIDAALDAVPETIFPYFELDHTQDVRGALAAMASMDAGAKIRTGGMTVDAHPTPRELARFIRNCAGAEVPFKATAGLHRPFRHDSPSVGCKQFGFLNVFIAACLAWSNNLDEDEIETMLCIESLDSFIIEDERVGHGDNILSIDAIANARDRFCHSFGSCSVDEPFDDLLALGLLQPGSTMSTSSEGTT